MWNCICCEWFKCSFLFIFIFWGLCLFSGTCCAVHVVPFVVCFVFFLLDVGCHDSPVCLFSVVVRGSAALFDFLGLQQYLCGVRVGQLGGVDAVLLWLV